MTKHRSKIFLTFRHIFFPEMVVQVLNIVVHFVTDIGEVEAFELTEDFVTQNVIESVYFGPAASDVNRHEFPQLFYDTVTERQTEMFDNVIIHFFEFFNILVAYFIIFLSFSK